MKYRRRKLQIIISVCMTMVMLLGNASYAAPQAAVPGSGIVTPQYRYLDTLTYGMSFLEDGRINCYAYPAGGQVTKFVISGDVQRKNSNNLYTYVCSWPEETTHGETAYFDKYCHGAGDGEYCFTLYIDVYSGNNYESLIFTYYKTRTTQ